MSNKLYNFNKLLYDNKKISNSVTCAVYNYVRKVNGKRVNCQFVTKYVSNIDVPYKRYTLK